MIQRYMTIYKQMIKDHYMIKINKAFLLKYKYNDPENCLIGPLKKVQGMDATIENLEGACQQIFGKFDHM